MDLYKKHASNKQTNPTSADSVDVAGPGRVVIREGRVWGSDERVEKLAYTGARATWFAIYLIW